MPYISRSTVGMFLGGMTTLLISSFFSYELYQQKSIHYNDVFIGGFVIYWALGLIIKTFFETKPDLMFNRVGYFCFIISSLIPMLQILLGDDFKNAYDVFLNILFGFGGVSFATWFTAILLGFIEERILNFDECLQFLACFLFGLLPINHWTVINHNFPDNFGF